MFPRVPESVFGASLGVLEGPWGVLGRSLGALGVLQGVPGGSLGGPWGSFGVPWGAPWGLPWPPKAPKVKLSYFFPLHVGVMLGPFWK